MNGSDVRLDPAVTLRARRGPYRYRRLHRASRYGPLCHQVETLDLYYRGRVQDSMRSRPARWCAIAFLSATWLFGQPAAHPGHAPLRMEVPQVLIPLTAVDRNGRLVTALDYRDFRVEAGGEEQKTSSLWMEDGPASILFVLDVSGSMKPRVDLLRSAVERVLDQASPEDEFGIVAFSDKPNLMMDFVPVGAVVRERVHDLRAQGWTSLDDAIVFALQQIRRAHHSNRALIVITDGRENYSRAVPQEVNRLAAETDARIYGIELYPPMGEAHVDPTLIESLAAATGGRYLPVVEPNRIPELAEAIDVHRYWILGFVPSDKCRDGQPHKVSVRLTRGIGSRGARLSWKELFRVPSP